MVDRSHLAAVLDRLDIESVPSKGTDAVDELVDTILAQNTRDHASAAAALRAAFPDWSALARAAEETIARVIWSGGLARVKARRIKLALTHIADDTRIPRLDHLAALSPNEARRWLSAVPGAGPKTAACVLLFGLGMPVLPVDDHVHRCVTRLGLVPTGLSPQQSHQALEAALDDDVGAVRQLHVGLHRLSRQICRPAAPRCDVCPLADVCAFA